MRFAFEFAVNMETMLFKSSAICVTVGVDAPTRGTSQTSCQDRKILNSGSKCVVVGTVVSRRAIRRSKMTSGAGTEAFAVVLKPLDLRMECANLRTLGAVKARLATERTVDIMSVQPLREKTNGAEAPADMAVDGSSVRSSASMTMLWLRG